MAIGKENSKYGLTEDAGALLEQLVMRESNYAISNPNRYPDEASNKLTFKSDEKNIMLFKELYGEGFLAMLPRDEYSLTGNAWDAMPEKREFLEKEIKAARNRAFIALMIRQA